MTLSASRRSRMAEGILVQSYIILERKIAIANHIFNCSTVSAIRERREADKVIYLFLIEWGQVWRFHIKWLLRDPLRENLHVAVAIFYIDEIKYLKDGRELLRK